MTDTIFSGQQAEAAGAKYLEKNGYKVLEKNYKSPFGEIDIIAQYKKELIFVEVKYRSSLKFGRPEDFVDKKKQLKIIKTALHYIKKHGIKKRDLRFDVLAFSSCLDNLEHINSAFQSPEIYKF